MPASSSAKARGGATDERSDLWAVGALLACALTGRRSDRRLPAAVAAVLAHRSSFDAADREAVGLAAAHAVGAKNAPADPAGVAIASALSWTRRCREGVG